MADQTTTRRLRKESLWLAVTIWAGSVAVLGCIIALVSLGLRDDLHDQVVQRHAEMWVPVTSFQVAQGMQDEVLRELPEDDVIMYSLLDIYDVEGAIGVQVYSPEGELLSGIPQSLRQDPLSADKVKRALQGEAWGHYTASNEKAEGELELIIPIGANGETLAVARFLMEGQGVAAELAALDGRLTRQAVIAFGGGSLLVSVILMFAFRRLRQAQAELEQRAKRLAEANHELALVAKTSAVGAVAAHLIHGLKNPLAGLREHVSTGGTGLEEEDWKEAERAALRMQSLINEVVEVLRYDQELEGEVTPCATVLHRTVDACRDAARERSVQLTWETEEADELSISERRAVIASLILSNLVKNAIEASPFGSSVLVRACSKGEMVTLSVKDEGCGFSEAARASLFTASRSEKPGGAGIGLAISRQLARHIGGTLELERSGPEGSVVSLKMGVDE